MVSVLSVILPVVVGAAALAYLIPQHIIPYNRKKNITKNIKAFLNRNRIFALSILFFIGGTIVMLMGLFIRSWSGDAEPAIVDGSVLALLALPTLITNVTKKFVHRRKRRKIPIQTKE